MRYLSALVLTLAASSLAAQVPYRYLVTAERAASGQKPGIVFIDPATGLATPAVADNAADTLREMLTLALDPSDPNTLYVNGDTGTFLGGDVWEVKLSGNRYPKVTHWRPTGMPGFAFPFKFEVLGKLVFMTIQGGSNNGLYEIDLTNRSLRKLPVTLPNFAGDIKVIGSMVYVSTDTSTGSTIEEWDTVKQTNRTLGAAYPQLKCLAVLKGKLLAGAANGDILEVDVPTGASKLLLATGLGSVNQIAVDPVSDEVFIAVQPSTDHEVYNIKDLKNALYKTPYLIRDLDVSAFDLPSLLRFGTGCQSSSQTTLAFDYVNTPKLGTTLNAKVVGGRPSFLAVLLFGSSRTQYGPLPLPFDLSGLGMTGCTLYSDVLLGIGIALNLSGEGTIGLPIPNVSALQGVHFTLQWLNRDPGVNAADLIASDGAEAIIR